MFKTVLLFLVLSLAVPASPLLAADAEDVAWSVLFPGTGQFRTGRYTRGTLFMGSEILALGGLWVVNIQYDREVEAYESAKALYESSTYIGDADYYYSRMTSAWDNADNLNGYRKALAGAAIGVWVVNVADMIWGKEAHNPPLALDVRRDGFMVCGIIRF
jgi:hypothetical protein